VRIGVHHNPVAYFQICDLGPQGDLADFHVISQAQVVDAQHGVAGDCVPKILRDL